MIKLPADRQKKIELLKSLVKGAPLDEVLRMILPDAYFIYYQLDGEFYLEDPFGCDHLKGIKEAKPINDNDLKAVIAEKSKGVNLTSIIVKYK